MRIEREKDSLILRENKGLNFALIFLVVAFALYLVLVCVLLTVEKTIGLIFSFLLLGIFEIFSIIAFLTKFDRIIIIDQAGVREDRRFLKKHCRKFSWDEIEDWGWSGTPSPVKRGFYFYFSPVPLPTVKKFKKANLSCLIMTYTNYDQRDINTEQMIIPYCESFAKVPVYRSPKY